MCIQHLRSPTSTTVLFELLGAVAVALVNIWQTDSGLNLSTISSCKALPLSPGILFCSYCLLHLVQASWVAPCFSLKYKKNHLITGAIQRKKIDRYHLFAFCRQKHNISHRKTTIYIHDGHLEL